MIRKILPGVLMAASVSAAGAAEPADPLAPLRACTTQSDSARRLACYDAAMSAAPPAPRAAAAAPVAAAAAKPASPEESFGYRGDIAREELDRKAAQEPRLERLDAKITTVETRPHGEFVITLDNGQVWAQKRPDTKVRPAVGEAISIKPGSFSSFTLVTASGRSTQVTRVR